MDLVCQHAGKWENKQLKADFCHNAFDIEMDF